MSGPAGSCDAPACAGELVALIRGVGLCEEHFQRVAECAAEQRVNPASLARPVIVALLRSPEANLPPAPPEAVPEEAKPEPPPAGFYWAPDEEEGWTVIQVERGVFRRIGRDGWLPLGSHEFARLVPIRLPDVYIRDSLLRRRLQRRVKPA